MKLINFDLFLQSFYLHFFYFLGLDQLRFLMFNFGGSSDSQVEDKFPQQRYPPLLLLILRSGLIHDIDHIRGILDNTMIHQLPNQIFIIIPFPLTLIGRVEHLISNLKLLLNL